MTIQTCIQHLSQLITLDSTWIRADNPLGIIADGAILIDDRGRIAWTGETATIPDDLDLTHSQIIEGRGKILTPGLIDSHTHPVFAGERADEFEMRLEGKSYLDIAAAGGGIQKTVLATREASFEDLLSLAESRLKRMLSFGVTTVEAKSGYGLDWPSEEKSLKVIEALKRGNTLQSVVATYMGAHDIPPEFKQNPDAYVDILCDEQLPRVAEARLAEFCDVFCEQGYFSVAQTRRILERARELGLGLKVHAEEFSTLGGAELAGILQAASADHLLHIDDKGIAAMKTGGVVATLLPGTAFFLRLNHYAPAREILNAGVPVALATDFNPGSCMTENIQMVMHLACLQMGMTPVEVLQGVTCHAARALCLDGDRGRLLPGYRADLCLWDVPQYQSLFYHWGVNHLQRVWIAGEPVLSL